MPELTNDQKLELQREYAETEIGRAAQARKWGITPRTQERHTRGIVKVKPYEQNGLTEETIARIRAMRKDGASHNKIQAETGVSLKTVRKYTANVEKGNREEDLYFMARADKIREHFWTGMTIGQISGKIGTNRNYVRNILQHKKHTDAEQQAKYPYVEPLSDGIKAPSKEALYALRKLYFFHSREKKNCQIDRIAGQCTRGRGIVRKLVLHHLLPDLSTECVFNRWSDYIDRVEDMWKEGYHKVYLAKINRLGPDKAVRKSDDTTDMSGLWSWTIAYALRYFGRIAEAYNLETWNEVYAKHVLLQEEAIKYDRKLLAKQEMEAAERTLPVYFVVYEILKTENVFKPEFDFLAWVQEEER